MDDFASDTDSDYTSYWRDWVSLSFRFFSTVASALAFKMLDWMLESAYCLHILPAEIHDMFAMKRAAIMTASSFKDAVFS